jgi:hypothetical protein
MPSETPIFAATSDGGKRATSIGMLQANVYTEGASPDKSDRGAVLFQLASAIEKEWSVSVRHGQ